MTLLAAIDGSDAGYDLLGSVRVLAKEAKWPVRILHARASEADPQLEVPAALRRGAQVREVVGDALAVIKGAADEPDVQTLAFCLSDRRGRRVGHVADALLREVHCGLLVGRPGWRPVSSLKRVLVPLEGSPSSSEAMRHADEAFCRRGHELIVLHVVTPETPQEPGSMPAPRMLDQEHYEWQSWQEEFKARFSQCPEGGRHRIVVRTGSPRQAILEVARELNAELVVMAWNRSLGEGRAESVKMLLEASPCPVLLVPVAAS